MSQKFPMTPRGHQILKDEVSRLKNVERPANVKAIEIARGHGDLKENADYSAAKERQSFIEGRLRELETKLAQSEVIDPTKLSGSRVVFGATVKLEEVESSEAVEYQIVGEDESDIKAGRISITAPLARAMIGKETGDVVKLTTQKGLREYEILEVRFE
jgi:transcription elongation factor GreA